MGGSASRCRSTNNLFADEVRQALELCLNLRAVDCALHLSDSGSTAPILSAIRANRSVRSINIRPPGIAATFILDLACRDKLDSLSLFDASPNFYIALSEISPAAAPLLTSLNVTVRPRVHYLQHSPMMLNN
jgi:hypothetical protein